jgi:hypothetical protein
MKRLSLAVLAATALLTAVACASLFDALGVQDFTLVNRTGLTIKEVYLSPVKASRWGRDVLGRDVLEDGERVPIKFSRDTKACHWDMKIVESRRTSLEWHDIDLCACSVLTLRYSRARGETTMSCTAPAPVPASR